MQQFLRFLFLLVSTVSFSQGVTVSGQLGGEGEFVSLAKVVLNPSGKQAVTNQKGLFEFTGVPPGSYLLYCEPAGYLPDSLPVIVGDSSVELAWTFTKVSVELNDFVVTGTRTVRRRLDSPIAVNILDAKTFQRTQSVCLSEGLAFQPGLRMETDCQTCNYSQLRMNGLGGSYSQVLINGRPLFSSLMGLYGLEQIPSNAIDRVEIVRGSGSVLYGSNAIAGTVNVITKLPTSDALSVQINDGLAGGRSNDLTIQANSVTVNDSSTAGLTIFTSMRKRGSYDANNDGYSEMPSLNGYSVGLSAFIKASPQAVFEASFWQINEERRGGNAPEKRPDEADQSEYRLQNSSIGQAAYTWTARNRKTIIQLFSGGQFTQREHYTGIDHADGWGRTRNSTFQSGIQYTRRLAFTSLGKMELNAGVEHLYDYTFDNIPGYNFLIDQTINQVGGYVQADWEITPKWTVLAGVRGNDHSLLNDLVFTPRYSLLFKPVKSVQLRLGYGRGFKAPQAFETDLHIAFASGGIALIQRDPDLKSELSDSWSFSADYNKSVGKQLVGLTFSAFSTQLRNAFMLTEIGQDTNGNTNLLRENGGTANVYGTTLEGRWKWSKWLQADLGYTVQRSVFNDAVAWSDALPAEKRFLRTPDEYGFINLGILPDQKWSGTIAGIYTGKMLVPHFGGAPETPADEVITSSLFFDCTVRLAYKLHIHRIEQTIEFAAGAQNLFNRYQSDFDTGKSRDSNYIYGPPKPRTIFLSLKWLGGKH